MKIKTWHLFLVVIILFISSFYVINLRFDKFYRVNGINNDNRILIEQYLDESEQSYLIDNQISIDLFIDYLEKDNFQLRNYKFYNSLKDQKRYTQIDTIIEVGNNLSTKLTSIYKNQAYAYATQLIDNAMEIAFLNELNFNFQYFECYKSLKVLYVDNDYSYINDTETYISKLKTLGYTSQSDFNSIFSQVSIAYTKDSLQNLLSTEVAAGVSLVFDPYDPVTLVDRNHYIGQYEAVGLILTQDIPRVRYAMYLQSDAYKALSNMYQALNQEHGGFLLMGAYQAPQTLATQDIGYIEGQLGFTITVNKAQTPYNEFVNTEMSEWLQENAHVYGYILRYPNKKASITNKAYDPHTYRYVGVEVATEIYEAQMTLEEYLNK